MPIQINFLSNVRDLVRGTSNVEDALGGVSDALDDVAADSQRSARKMAESQKDAARDIDQSNERLERSFKELAESSKRSTSQVGDDLARNTRRSTEQAGESVKEFGNEAKQNISETFSSFRGDVTDFGQIAQDTLGGLASGLDGIPAIAAVAAGAAGIGLLLAALENGQVSAEQFKQAVSDLTGEMIDAGTDGSAPLEHIVDTLKKMATGTDDLGHSLKDLDKAADGTSTSYEDLATAYAGNIDKLQEVWRESKRAEEAKRREVGAIHDTTGAIDAEAYARSRAADQQRNVTDLLGQSIGVAKEAADAQKLYAEAGGPEMQAHADALEAYASSVQQSLQDAGSAWEDYNKDGTTNLDDYNQHIEDSIAATAAYQTNVKIISQQVSQDALNYLLSLGEEAAPILQAYVDAPLAQQQRTAANWDALGKTSGTSYTNALKSSIPDTVPGPHIVIDDVDTGPMVRSIQQTLAGHTFKVNAYATVRSGNAVLG